MIKLIDLLKKFNILGSRTLKTGISVFLTALVCGLFNWPVVFAVITAIVTIEHTAADSIKKAAVRFPASAIGALLATTCYAVFGKSAITFALAAMLTIAICHKLRLDAGILVATITAVAMIPDFQDHYILSFLTRLGTTSIGIVVSTGVNFFLLPPNYTPRIFRSINDLFGHAAQLLERIVLNADSQDKEGSRSIGRSYRLLTAHLERTYQLSQFQRAEWKYHRHTNEEMRFFQFAQKKLGALQQIAYHLGNLQYVQTTLADFKKSERELMEEITHSYIQILKDPAHQISENHFDKVKKLDQLFWKWKEDHVVQENHFRQHLPPQTILIYELLSFHDVLEELEEMCKSRHQMVEKCYVNN
ncbi:aromatic acid exporter family protein [Halobacillus sp. Marseille-Q1614]|uniref:FUSC family protein n=1 Tax=Halobacillus sp. Marseille-Q1614 TaxID=2709134 RepID=UPI00156E3511|nr:aromatic acid exporter family protein [Halobacillus sp. Marseille-Q1614]